MRKLSQGGGIFNILDANTKWPIPQVGDGATILSYSDRDAGTVIEVIKKGIMPVIVVVQEDNAVRTDKNGQSESQTYEFSRNPNGRIRHFRQAKNGTWDEVIVNPETNRWKKNGSTNVKFGVRESYYDPTF